MVIAHLAADGGCRRPLNSANQILIISHEYPWSIDKFGQCSFIPAAVLDSVILLQMVLICWYLVYSLVSKTFVCARMDPVPTWSPVVAIAYCLYPKAWQIGSPWVLPYVLAIDVQHSGWQVCAKVMLSCHQVPHVLHEYIRIIKHHQVVSFPMCLMTSLCVYT